MNAPAAPRGENQEISGCREFLAVAFSHPLLDCSRWTLLAGEECRNLLRGEGLRLRFCSGRLSVWGEGAPRARMRTEESPAPGQSGPGMELYLFCSDPYFTRCGDVPVFRPGRELLRFSFSPALEVAVAPFGEDRRAEVCRIRRQCGVPPGPPPVALLSLPRPSREKARLLECAIAPRRARWVYEVFPPPQCRLEVRGPYAFHREKRQTGKDAVRFVAGELIPLSGTGLRGFSLVLADEEGREMPLLDNLPSPGPENMAWDAEKNEYTATVRLDLRRFGISA